MTTFGDMVNSVGLGMSDGFHQQMQAQQAQYTQLRESAYAANLGIPSYVCQSPVINYGIVENPLTFLKELGMEIDNWLSVSGGVA